MSRRESLTRWTGSLVVSLIAGGLAGALVESHIGDGPSENESMARSAERAVRSVVAINAQVRSYEGSTAITTGCSGTGIVLTADGLIATAAHVVEGACAIVVTTGDGRQIEARVLGIDPSSDLAVLQASASDLEPATLGSSKHVTPGERVLTVGFALGLIGPPTISAGVVSAVGRSIDSGTAGGLHHLIQIDAAVNEGGSGGPLVNEAGLVIGITTGRLTLGENIGFAVAIDQAIPVFERLASRSLARR